jgi:hypothetical protein
MTETNVPKADFGRPHLLILGSGASRAALPDGDLRGRPAPLFQDLPDILEADALLSKFGIERAGRNFEELYSDIHETDPNHEVLGILEERVRGYFSDLELPDSVNLYDHIVLSLRPKDFIATFNWDPFLLQALQRNARVSRIPHVAFLHGCATLGICEKDWRKAPFPGRCSVCQEPLRPSRLLFPVKEKDYDTDPHIAAEWESFQEALQSAYILTIFGYGAPITDTRAFMIMKGAWSQPGERGLEETEIIDIREPDELHSAWSDFIVRAHYRIFPDFSRSTLARFPRRSCETIWNQFMMLQVPEDNHPPATLSLLELQDWYRSLVDLEDGASANA